MNTNTQPFYNKIYFGPPGTGKSFKLKQLLNNSNQNNIFRVTFHEDYSYYDFLGQYKPVVIYDFLRKISNVNGVNEASPIISYEFVSGIFINSYIAAHKTSENVYLIIEELNRGNCSAIFGDIFQLLDRGASGSEYPIKTSKELCKFLTDNAIINPHELSLPQNLKIVATMNTSDQSLFPIDSAFKRRWQQEYCKIEYSNVALKNVLIEGTNITWLKFIQKINEKVLYHLQNEDKQIGHWFVQADKVTNKISEEDFKYKVLSYLYYDVFKHHRFLFKDDSFVKVIEKSNKDIVNGLME